MRLLDRKPAKRLGMLSGRAADIKAHPWFRGFDWEALGARKMPAPRVPKAADSAKRKDDLAATPERAAAQPTAEELAEFQELFADF